MASKIFSTTLVRLGCGLVFALAWAPGAQAYIVQEVLAGYWSDPERSGGLSDSEYDAFVSPPGTPRDLWVQVSGSGYHAVSAAGVLGNLGMQGSHEAVGAMETYVEIRNTEIVNPYGGPRFARANFIIDGGYMEFLAGPIAVLDFHLSVVAVVYDSEGGGGRYTEWRTGARLRCLDFSPPQLSTYGSDIGIHMTDLYRADIPSSFQTFEIGVVPGGGRIDLIYLALFESKAPAVEFSEFQYSDPLSVSGEGEFPTLEFAPVPELATLSVLAIGTLSLLRRRKKTT